MNVSFRSQCRFTAFTLIELLVSMLVLTVLVVIVAQMTNQTSMISAHSQDKMDMDNQARLVLDRIEADLARMVKRKDVDYIFFKPAAGTSDNNDAMFFYSESPGYYIGTVNATTGASNKSSLTLTGYRISNNFQLERLGKTLSWDGSSASGPDPGAIVFLTYSSPTSTPYPFTTIAGNWSSIGTAARAYKDGGDGTYRTLGAQVFRMETCFQIKKPDGTSYYSAQPTNPALAITSVPMASAVYLTASGSMQGLPNELVAIVTTIAMLDNTTFQQLGPDLKTVALNLPKFPDPAQPNSLPGQDWQDQVDKGNLAASTGYPQTTMGRLRIYQRVSYLNIQ